MPDVTVQTTAATLKRAITASKPFGWPADFYKARQGVHLLSADGTLYVEATNGTQLIRTAVGSAPEDAAVTGWPLGKDGTAAVAKLATGGRKDDPITITGAPGRSRKMEDYQPQERAHHTVTATRGQRQVTVKLDEYSFYPDLGFLFDADATRTGGEFTTTAGQLDRLILPLAKSLNHSGQYAPDRGFFCVLPASEPTSAALVSLTVDDYHNRERHGPNDGRDKWIAAVQGEMAPAASTITNPGFTVPLVDARRIVEALKPVGGRKVADTTIITITGALEADGTPHYLHYARDGIQVASTIIRPVADGLFDPLVEIPARHAILLEPFEPLPSRSPAEIRAAKRAEVKDRRERARQRTAELRALGVPNITSRPVNRLPVRTFQPLPLAEKIEDRDWHFEQWQKRAADYSRTADFLADVRSGRYPEWREKDTVWELKVHAYHRDRYLRHYLRLCRESGERSPAPVSAAYLRLCRELGERSPADLSELNALPVAA